MNSGTMNCYDDGCFRC